MSSAARDFLNRREPGARWMILLLVLLFIAEVLAILFGHAARGDGLAFIHFVPPALALLALSLQRWWSLPAAPAFPDQQYAVPRQARRWVMLIAAAITLLAAWPRSAPLSKGYTSEEVSTLTAAAAAKADGALALQHSAALAAVQMSGGVPNNERVPRTLPFIAGLVTIGLLVILSALLASPRAGVAAGLILALHPAHVQWSTQVSDVTLQQCGVVLAALFFILALRSSGWRWWFGAALSPLPFVAGHPEFGYALIAAAAAAALVIRRYSPAAAEDKRGLMIRMIPVLALSSAALMLPVSVHPAGLENASSFSTAWMQFCAGGESTFSARILSWAVAPMLFAGGLLFMLRQDWRTFWLAMLAVLLLAGAAAGMFHAAVLLPLVFAWCGTGLARRFPRLQHAPVIIAVLFAFVMTGKLQRRMKLPESPLREAARAAREEHGAQALTVTIQSGLPAARFYDPAVQAVANLEGLRALTEKAFDSDTPLLFYFQQASGPPDPLIQEVEGGGRFRLRAEFAAADSQGSVRIYEYHPEEQVIRINVQKEKPGNK